MYDGAKTYRDIVEFLTLGLVFHPPSPVSMDGDHFWLIACRKEYSYNNFRSQTTEFHNDYC